MNKKRNIQKPFALLFLVVILTNEINKRDIKNNAKELTSQAILGEIIKRADWPIIKRKIAVALYCALLSKV